MKATLSSLVLAYFLLGASCEFDSEVRATFHFRNETQELLCYTDGGSRTGVGETIAPSRCSAEVKPEGRTAWSSECHHEDQLIRVTLYVYNSKEIIYHELDACSEWNDRDIVITQADNRYIVTR